MPLLFILVLMPLKWVADRLGVPERWFEGWRGLLLYTLGTSAFALVALGLFALIALVSGGESSPTTAP
jgi:hypothetical protein